MYGFDYQRPNSLQMAATHLQQNSDARALAGGQSLVQAMKLRLSQPSDLVDLAGLPELHGINRIANGVRIGAMSRHSEVASSALILDGCPALAALASGIGDPMVRNMGTLGGSLANADPAACYPAACLALNAMVHTNLRSIPADDFFTGLYQTALQTGELITHVEFTDSQSAAYEKFKQPASRFALVGVFVNRSVTDGVRVAVTGAKSSVYRDQVLEAALNKAFAVGSLNALNLSTEGINSDIHGSASYRAAMVLEMAKRAVARIIES